MDISWVEPQKRIQGSHRMYLWATCPDCHEEVWVEPKGQFYHKLDCPHSNGIGYGEERNRNPTLPHHHQCECLRCKSK